MKIAILKYVSKGDILNRQEEKERTFDKPTATSVLNVKVQTSYFFCYHRQQLF